MLRTFWGVPKFALSQHDAGTQHLLRTECSSRKAVMIRASMRLVLLLLLSIAAASDSGLSILRADDARRYELPATDDGIPGAGPIRRYDWFKGLWKERRAAWAKKVEQDQKAVVFLGDSITQGWGDEFHGLFPGMKAANRGISGDTTRGMLLRLEQDVLSLSPAAVVMLMGTNDLEEQAEPQVIVDNIKLIVDELKKHNAAVPIVLCQVFPSSATKKRPADKIREINKLTAKAVMGDPQITVLDTYTLFANEQGDAKAEEMPDLLHLNEHGYRKWAAALTPILATLGFLETEPDGFAPEDGFESLFNGKDLTGWGHDGKTATPDGRYVAKNGRLIVTTPAEGRRVQQLYTAREFPGNFTLKLEFRATPNADSGVFIRRPQLQCRDYLLAGPYKMLKNY